MTDDSEIDSDFHSNSLDDLPEAVPAGSAILRAVRILEAIARHDTPPQLSEICREVELPKPTVYRILTTLEHAGLVGREPGSKRYACSERMSALAVETLVRSPARGSRRAVLEELVEQLGETCNITIPNNNSVLYLDRIETGWPLRTTFSAGSKVPLYASASGKLFLSYLPKRSRERFLRVTPLIRHTQKTFTDPARLGREFAAIRSNGYATDDEEYLSGICSLTVPIRDADQRVVAAVEVQAPVSRLRLEEAIEFLPQLRQAADAIAQTIDW